MSEVPRSHVLDEVSIIDPRTGKVVVAWANKLKPGVYIVFENDEALRMQVWNRNGDHDRDYSTDRQGFENGQLRVFKGEERKRLGWEGEVVRYYRNPSIQGSSLCSICGRTHHDHGWIDHGAEGQLVCPGNWIVTDPQGKHTSHRYIEE